MVNFIDQKFITTGSVMVGKAQPVRPDVEIKSSQNFSKAAQKVGKAVFL